MDESIHLSAARKNALNRGPLGQAVALTHLDSEVGQCDDHARCTEDLPDRADSFPVHLNLRPTTDRTRRGRRLARRRVAFLESSLFEFGDQLVDH